MDWTRTIRKRLLTYPLVVAGMTALAGDTMHVKPTESLSTVREKLENDPRITEVVFEEGIYAGSLYVSKPRISGDADLSQYPLLIRAAQGASVLFEGAKPMEKVQRHEKESGVFCMDYTHRGGDYPKLWEPRTRMRYRLVADRQSVARFVATYSIEGNRLLFHTSDGQPPGPDQLLMSAEDCGLFINRPQVTVHGIAFQNFLARDKWSTAIDLRVDHIVVEDCRSTNCSMGFIITGQSNVLRRCTAEDIGGGVYVGGENATVEACRFYKRRDTFMVPMYRAG